MSNLRSIVYELENLSLMDFDANGMITPKACLKLLERMEWTPEFKLNVIPAGDKFVLTVEVHIISEKHRLYEGQAIGIIDGSKEPQWELERLQGLALQNAMKFIVALNGMDMDMVYELARLKAQTNNTSAVQSQQVVTQPQIQQVEQAKPQQVPSTSANESSKAEQSRQKTEQLQRLQYNKPQTSHTLDKQTKFLFDLLTKVAQRTGKSVDQLTALLLPLGTQIDTLSKRDKSILIDYLKMKLNPDFKEFCTKLEKTAIDLQYPLIRFLDEIVRRFAKGLGEYTPDELMAIGNQLYNWNLVAEENEKEDPVIAKIQELISDDNDDEAPF
jgi:hypothetical protein